MSDDRQLSARIDALEIRLSYQDDIIETLNMAVIAQSKQIDGLTSQMSALSDRLQDAETGAPIPANERPPHY